VQDDAEAAKGFRFKNENIIYVKHFPLGKLRYPETQQRSLNLLCKRYLFLIMLIKRLNLPRNV